MSRFTLSASKLSVFAAFALSLSACSPNVSVPDDKATAGSAGSLPNPVVVAAVAPQDIEEAVEFYHSAFDHYFITSSANEINALDTGHFTGWTRTGLKFNVIRAGSSAAGSNPVCRFYGRPEAGLDSHFYSASPQECQEVIEKFSASWQYESPEVFRAMLPNTATGVCPAGTKPVYRLWNKRTDSNHRYTTELAVFNQMVARGYQAEGYGPVNQPVALCSPDGAAGGGAFKLTCEEARFLKLINLYRASKGIGSLTASVKATQAARWHSNDMGVNHYFSHTDSLGRDPYSRTADFGFNWCQGENAAAGNSTGRDTFCQWKNSPGHDANMLRSQFRSIGIGRVQVGGSDYGIYWSTPFGVGFDTGDDIAEPTTDEPGCTMPTVLPSC